MSRFLVIGLLLALVMLAGCGMAEKFFQGFNEDEFVAKIESLQEKLEQAQDKISEEGIIDLNQTKKLYGDISAMLGEIKDKQMSLPELIAWILGLGLAGFGGTHVHRLKAVIALFKSTQPKTPA